MEELEEEGGPGAVIVDAGACLNAVEVGAEDGSESIASLFIPPSLGTCWSYSCWAAGWSASEEMVSLLPGASFASASAREDMEAPQSQNASSVADVRCTEAVREWLYSRSYLCVPGCQSGPPALVISVLDARHLRRSHQSASAASQKNPIIATTAPIIPPVLSLSGEVEVVPWLGVEEAGGTSPMETNDVSTES